MLRLKELGLMDFEDRKKMRRSKQFSRTNSLWNDLHINRAHNIGKINYVSNCFLERATNKEVPFNLDGFRDTYIDIYGVEKIIKAFELFDQRLKERGINLDRTFLLNATYIRVVDEGYIGVDREIKAMEILKKRYPEDKLRFATDEEDRTYFVDIIRETTGPNGKKYTIAYQVKGEAFFKYKKEHVIAYNKKGHKKLKEDRNINTWWFKI